MTNTNRENLKKPDFMSEEIWAFTKEATSSLERNLYSEPRPEVEKPAGQVVVGVRMLDADFSRVVAGSYRLLLGIGNTLCDTGATLVLTSH